MPQLGASLMTVTLMTLEVSLTNVKIFIIQATGCYGIMILPNFFLRH